LAIEVFLLKSGQFVKYLLYFVTRGISIHPRATEKSGRSQSNSFGVSLVTDIHVVGTPVVCTQADRAKPLILYGESTMNQPIELSLEQQFSLRSFETQVSQMSREQAQQFLMALYEQMMLREATYKQLLKHQWGIESFSYED
jgi:Phycobilisome degradation protein nblA